MSIVRRLMRLAGGSGDDSRPGSESVERIARAFEDFDDETARYLGAFAYVLARLATSDHEVDDREVAVIELALLDIAGIEPGHARLVAEAAHIEAAEEGGTQNYLATREFRRLASREQRVLLLKCLLQVAGADGEITPEERTTTLNIAEELGFSPPELTSLRAEIYKARNQLQEPKG